MAKRRGFDLAAILAPVDGIVKQLRRRHDDLTSELALVDAELARFGSSRNGTAKRGPKATGKASGGRKGKRVRRSREDIEATARDIVKFIQDGGKEGRSGREIKAKFGAVTPSTKAFLKEYAPDSKIKTTGAKASMRYHA